MISRAILLAATAGAGAYLYTTVASFTGTEADRIALVFALKILLVPAIALAFLLTKGAAPGRARLAAWLTRRPAVALALVIVGSAASAWLTTPQIAFGEGRLGTGYGADGQIYGWMADNFAWFEHHVRGRFGYRWLAPMLVHYSGLDTFTGFWVLNLASHAGACVLLYLIAAHFAPGRPAALLAVALFAVLKFGLRFWVYYPVLTDGLGSFLLMAILWATLAARPVVYLLAMTAAVCTRENLLILVGFNLLHVVRAGAGSRRLAAAVALQLIPLGAFLLSRRYPVFVVDDLSARLVLTAHARQFLLDPARQTTFFLAYLNSLGVLAILLLLDWRSVARFVAERYEWAYYVAASVLLAVVAGSDTDRFALWLAPFAIGVVIAQLDGWRDELPRIWLWWLALQTVAMEFVLPWYPEESFAASRFAAHAEGPALAQVVVASYVLFGAVVAMKLNDPEDPQAAAGASRPGAGTGAAPCRLGVAAHPSRQ